MAKPRDLEGLDCDRSFSAAAALVVAVRIDEVLEHAAGAERLDDLEPLHDLRVATRRLRAALEMFEPCFRRKRRKRATKRLKRLARALGERRDRDVAIEYLHGCLDAVAAEDRPRLEELIGRLRREQREANEKLVPLLEGKRLAKLRRRFAELTEGLA